MYRIHADSLCNGVDDRRDEKYRSAGLHEHAEDEQDDIYKQQDDYLVAGYAGDSRRDGLGQAQERHDSAEEGRGCHYKKDLCRGQGGLLGDRHDILYADLLVHEHADDKAVYNGNGRGFGRSENPGVDTAEDDDRHQECGQRLDKRSEEGFLRGILLCFLQLLCGLIIIVLLYKNTVEDDKGNGGEHAGADDCEKDLAYRHACGAAVNDGRDAGWNEYSQEARSACQCRGILGLIVMVLHFRDHDAADCGNRGSGGTGDRAEERAGKNGYVAEGRDGVSEAALCEVYELLGNAAVAHYVAGKHEERQRQYRERVNAAEGGLSHKASGIGAGASEVQDAGQSEAHTYRQAEEDQYKKDNDESHLPIPPFIWKMLSVTAWKIESTLPMHIELYIIHFGILRPLESWWFTKASRVRPQA